MHAHTHIAAAALQCLRCRKQRIRCRVRHYVLPRGGTTDVGSQAENALPAGHLHCVQWHQL